VLTPDEKRGEGESIQTRRADLGQKSGTRVRVKRGKNAPLKITEKKNTSGRIVQGLHWTAARTHQVWT